MSPPRSSSAQARPSTALVRQSSLQQPEPPSPPPSSSGVSAPRRGLLRRQRSTEEADRPVSRLLHSALRVTASALGPSFLAQASPPPPPPPPAPKISSGKLRPVRVAWAELRKGSNGGGGTDTSLVGQRVGLSKAASNAHARVPTCLPALARANLDIFLAHSGLAQCITSTLTDPSSSPVVTRDPPITSTTPSPREAGPPSTAGNKPPPLSPLPCKPPLLPSPVTPLSANSRRGQFRSSTYRAVNRSFSDSSNVPEQKLQVTVDTRSARVLSAPAHRAAPLVPALRPPLRSLPRRAFLPQTSFDGEQQSVSQTGQFQQQPPQLERNIRSAPARRRPLKAGVAASRRRGGTSGGLLHFNTNSEYHGRRGEESSGDDDEDCYESTLVSAAAPPRVSSATSSGGLASSASLQQQQQSGGRGRRGLRAGAEIVTMVSLVSPAHSSDSEDESSTPVAVIPVPPPPTPPATSQDLGRPPIITSMASLTSVIVCARKISKSVSFQTGLIRRASTQLALAVTAATTPPAIPPPSSAPTTPVQPSTEPPLALSPALQTSTTTSAPVIKPPPPPVIQSTPKKRPSNLRLKFAQLESKNNAREEQIKACDSNKITAPSSPKTNSPQQTPNNNNNEEAALKVAPPDRGTPEKQDSWEGEDGETRPVFETPKEKECWQLYRKMCEKGLTVSFDTVLRGMLTPTEYRLRRSALLSSC